MKIFVWEQAKHVTNNWDSEGGVIVFAESEKRARELANAENGCKIEDEEMPDFICNVDATKERLFIMPDAGSL